MLNEKAKNRNQESSFLLRFQRPCVIFVTSVTVHLSNQLHIHPIIYLKVSVAQTFVSVINNLDLMILIQ